MNQSSYASSYRSEIDGLRAFAVLSVVAFHAFPSWLKGGFIGVDVFFVISGFLITSHIFEKLDKGNFSFTDFFGRRIRRIFPALILVMACSLAFGWFALLADEYQQLGKHVFGGSIFLSNFIYWDEAISYLTNSNDTKPMLHLWSLAVEEQFYIVWPFILWAVWKGRFNLLSITVLVAVISFYLNLKFVKSHPIETFFWPIGRFWELLSGSIAAWLILYKAEALSNLKLWFDKYLVKIVRSKDFSADGSTTSNLMSFFGLLLLTYGVIRINESLSFPSKWALIPVLGAVLIIASGSKAWLNRILLMNPIAVWFGLISYPLYLWHWPILSFFNILEGQFPNRELRIGAVILSVLLAWLTYKLIETPFRRKIKSIFSSLFLIFGMIIVGSVGKWIDLHNGISERLEIFLLENERSFSQINSAAKIKQTDVCRKVFSSLDRGLCVYEGDSSPTILLFGDSHALHFYRGVRDALPNEEVAMLGGGWGGIFEEHLNPIVKHRGRELTDKIYNEIKGKDSIHTVIIAHIASGNTVDDFVETFDYFSSLGKEVIYVVDIPKIDFDPKKCFDSRPLRLFQKEEFSCSTPKDIALKPMLTYRKNVLSALSKRPKVKYFDAAEALCDENFCYAKIDNKLLYSNSGKNPHLSVDGELMLGSMLGDLFTRK